MKKSTQIVVFLLGVIGLTSLKAQDKFGYVDETYIITQTEEYKKTKAELDEYQKVITTELQNMEKKYQEKAKAFDELSKKPDTPQSVLEAKAKELDELAKQVRDLQGNAQKEYQDKLAKSLEPVVAKIKKAVEEISKEQGGIFIFRKEGLIFQVEENNISDMVLKKLNIPVTTPVANRGNLKSQNKIGFFNAKYATPQLPAYKQAASEMKTFEEMLKKEIEVLMKDYEKAASELNPEVNPNFAKMDDATKKIKYEGVQKMELKIQEKDAEAQKKLQEKYNQKMEPISKALQEKVNEVAKENGYTFIFSVEGSLFEKKEADISDLVLKKFGVTPATTENTNKGGQ